MSAKRRNLLRLTSVTASLAIALTLLLAAPVPGAEAESQTIAGLPAVDALRLGERMYREGILPSGEPMRAIVQRDIEVVGTMFSCESCHLRSGMGSAEGKIITLPTNATELFKPFTSAAEEAIPAWEKMPQPIRWKIRRPAYTDETLAMALWAGLDPGGREFDWTMPRYLLEDRDMEILIYYLRQLSAAPSPGVTETTIRLATVFSADVAPTKREAMLAVLEAHIQARNGQSRRDEERAKRSPFYRKKITTAYRRLELARWELKGDPETWGRQLAEYYRQAPVFAILGGITNGEWEPVHNFSEENRIPCILPLTEYPVISESGWYTLYFSKGRYQEGETAARFLRNLAEGADDRTVVQVYRDDRDGRILAQAFREARQKLRQSPPQEMVLGPETRPGADFWRELGNRYQGAIILLWLAPGDLSGLDAMAALPVRPASLFASAGLLGGTLTSIPEPVRDFTYLTYPSRLPSDEAKHMAVVKSWLRVKGIPEDHLEIQSRMYFAGWLLSNALMMMGSDYYRDYFLDGIDMMNDEVYAIANYPRLSFGQGQRYAAKGCYVVQLGAGTEPAVIPRSDWVFH